MKRTLGRAAGVELLCANKVGAINASNNKVRFMVIKWGNSNLCVLSLNDLFNERPKSTYFVRETKRSVWPQKNPERLSSGVFSKNYIT